MRTFGIMLFVLCICVIDVRAESASGASRIKQLVAELDHDEFQVREAAQRELAKVGEAAIDAVRKATMSESAEVRFRAQAILRQFVFRGIVLHLSMERQPHNLTKHGDVRTVQDRQGRKNHAVEFHSGGYLIVPDAEALDTDEQFTLAAWVKPSEFVPVLLPEMKEGEDELVYPWGKEMARWDGHYIVAKWLSEAIHGDYIFTLTPSGHLGLGVSDYSSGYHWDALHSKRPLKMQQWVHVAATFDRGEMKLFVGAKLVAEKRSTQVTQTSLREYGKDDIYVGALWNNRYNFRGAIDEVCIFNRALSQQEINALSMLTR